MGILNLFRKNKEKNNIAIELKNDLDISVNLKNVYFKMRIEDIFKIKQIGTVLTGIIDQGTIKKDTEVLIVNQDGVSLFTCNVFQLENMNGVKDSASKGENIALGIKECQAESFKKGDYVVVQ